MADQARMRRERDAAQFLISQYGAKKEHIEECLRIIEAGDPANLVDLMRQKGYLGAEKTIRLDSKPAEPAPKHEKIGKYTLLSCLGRGGMGEVWKAWEEDLKRHVAIKFLTGFSGDDQKRFTREAQVVAGLDHPAIAPIFDLGTHEILTYLVMRLINGTTIDKAGLDMPEMLEAIRQIALALDYAHKRGIVHRDLKPSNIMVEGKQPFLMDFGLAKQTQVESSISQTGQIMGTPHFMSPEQARGQTRTLDSRTDVYSLGATLYTLLTGRTPFKAEEALEILRKVIEEEPIAPRTIRPDIPRDVETIVLKAMEKDPQRRYPTAKDLAEDLGRYLDGDPILARRTSVTYRFTKKVSKHRWLAIAIGTACLLAAGFGMYVLASSMAVQRQQEMWLSEARKSEAKGELENAVAALDRAGALGPLDAAYTQKRSELQGRIQKEKDALSAKAARETALRKATEVFKEAERDLHMLRLRSYRADWKLTESELALYEALQTKVTSQMKLTGDSADGWWVVGRAHEILGNSSGARLAYEKALGLNAHHGPSLLYRARMLISSAIWERFVDQSEDSETHLREAQELISRGIVDGGLNEIEQDIAKGFELVVRGQPAREYCTQMLQKWKGKDFWEEFYLIRGLAHAEGLFDDATQAIQARPGYYEAYFHRSSAPGCMVEMERSIRDLDKAIELNPQYFEAILARGTMHRLLRRFDAALRDETRALEIEPNSVPALSARAAVYIESGDRANAKKDLERALELEPDHPSALLARSHLRAIQGDAKGALEDMERVIALRPRRSEGYSNRGTLRLTQGKYDEAMKDFDKAIELNPQNVQFWIKRGYTKRMKKDLQGAIADYTRGIEANPKDSEVYYYRGTAYSLLKQYPQAVEDLAKSVELNPRYPLAVYNLAYIRMVMAESENDSAARKRLLVQAVKGFEDAQGLGVDKATVEKSLLRARARLKELGE